CSVLIAGSTSTAAVWLVEASNNLDTPAYYPTVIPVIGIITALAMKVTAKKPVRGAAAAAYGGAEAVEILREHYDNIEHKSEAIDEEIAALQKRRHALIDP
ncbi:proline/betaine transporter, partial [Morganella morganii]|nr:proline/betaine transporter [Morganella morganii]